MGKRYCRVTHSKREALYANFLYRAVFTRGNKFNYYIPVGGTVMLRKGRAPIILLHYWKMLQGAYANT